MAHARHRSFIALTWLAACSSGSDAATTADASAAHAAETGPKPGGDVAPAPDASAAHAAETGPKPDGDAAAAPDAPPPHCRRHSEEREAFFGDLHVHTALSLDANLQGARLRPTDTYRFARGEEVGVPPYDEGGKPLRTRKLERALDFVAVSDHAEFLGLVTTCVTPGLPGYDSFECEIYRTDPDTAFIFLNAGLAVGQPSAGYLAPCTQDNSYCGSAALSAWNEVQQAAAAANDDSDACAFTAFVAYEWSASPGLQNLHRNVIFKGAEVPTLPFSYFDGSEEEDLWSALEKDCTGAGSGCDALTIPHNSNLSAGIMFEPLDRDGKPIDAAYAQKRASFEPLVEIFQHKGSSECLPELGNDEQCGFEIMPYNNLGSVTLGGLADQLTARDFVRDALGQGLKLGAQLGTNPFAYGFVGSTDSHLGLSGGVEEYAFQGHGGAGSGARTTLPTGLADHPWLNPGGLAVLWAEENSRESLFAAMRRREAYATSGPRIVLRFFAGDLDAELCGQSDFVKQGYAHGVPMGGELRRGSGAPRFALWAQRDPGTASHAGVALQRVQIIKGWLAAGEVKYAVHDVAQTERLDADVDLATCEPRGAGADELCAVWSDPDFSADQPAFYYARVLENPSCRWQSYACAAANIDCDALFGVPAEFQGCCDQPATQQERAWSSPIFYRAE